MKRIDCDRILTPQGIRAGSLYFEDGKILDITTEKRPVDEVVDASGDLLCPGFVDMHTHGGGGHPFEGTVDDIVAGCDFHLRHGTTSLCPTVSAAPFPQMAESALRIGAAARDPRLKGTVLGAHMEGPYLSAKQAGAQCPDFITPPREEEYLPFLAEHSALVARWTYAPENDEGEGFVRALTRYGIVPSAGHTDAVHGDLLRAAEQGCRLITHLYSCTSTVTRVGGFRRLGVIESAFLSDDTFVEIICDGKHLPPDLIRLIYKIKGPDRIALVTDSLALAGTDQREGRMQNTDYIIEDGVCKLKDRSAFAGSIATADRLLRVAVTEGGIPLPEAVRMLTEIPADLMKASGKGRLVPGADADFVVLDDSLRVRRVYARGVDCTE